MNSKWKGPKTIIGPVATGEFYYQRDQIVEEIWDELEKGNFILLAAPRRVGKTSIMRDIERNSREGYNAIFHSIQAVTSEQEFYKTIYKLIVTCFTKSTELQRWFTKYTKTRTISEVTIEGVKLEKTQFPYKDEINDILNELTEEGETVILLIDELPEVLHKLNKNGRTEEAKSILSQLRTWRQSGHKKLQFVFAGSIGIHYVVKQITGRVSDINDLVKINCAPLTEIEAYHYIEWTTKDATVQYDTLQKEYVVNKIQHYYTPYFLNLMLEEINKLAKKRNNPTITQTDIDTVFDNIVKVSDHFKEWKNRLEDYMPKGDFLFVNEILTHIAHRDSISIQEIYDKASSHHKQTDYMDFMGDLEEDGYIVKNDNSYQFISPFLKSFWKINQPIYHG